ncbi:MAG: hypothetical protein K2X27_27000 [Candidatus Obscuribacterales bacterium]|nr:hypothetical protein [Candidatus Obscuribacterales bacterium]
MALLTKLNAQKQSSIQSNRAKSPLISNPRSRQGSVLAEGVLGTWLVISALSFGATFLVNSGLATYYKQRLGFITNQVATLAANEIASPMFTSTADTEATTKERAKRLIKDLGLPAPQSVDVVIDPPQSPPTSVNPPSSVETKVTVTVHLFGMQLIGNGTILPSVLALQDTSVVTVDRTRPRYAANMLEECSQVGGGVGVGITLPAYGGYSYAHGVPSNDTVRGVNGKIYYSLDNKFGDGTIANPGGGFLFNTNWQAGPTPYSGVQTAQQKLFAVEGTLAK